MIPSDILDNLDFPGPLRRDCILYDLTLAVTRGEKSIRINTRGFEQQIKVVEAAHRGEGWAVEYFINQGLLSYECRSGRRFDKATYQKVRETGDRQIKEKPGPAEFGPLDVDRLRKKLEKKDKQATAARARKLLRLTGLDDENAYHLTTCRMILKSGSGFLKVDNENVVLRKKDNSGQEGISPIEALAKLLRLCDSTTRKEIGVAEDSNLPDECIKPDDKYFIRQLQYFFRTTCKKANIKEFNFSTKRTPPSPQGILMYLLENI